MSAIPNVNCSSHETFIATPTPAIQLIGFLRLSHIIGNPKSIPPKLPIIPVSRSTWWAGVKSGRYPTPIKLSPRVTVWRAIDIAALIAQPEGWADQ